MNNEKTEYEAVKEKLALAQQVIVKFSTKKAEIKSNGLAVRAAFSIASKALDDLKVAHLNGYVTDSVLAAAGKDLMVAKSNLENQSEDERFAERIDVMIADASTDIANAQTELRIARGLYFSSVLKGVHSLLKGKNVRPQLLDAFFLLAMEFGQSAEDLSFSPNDLAYAKPWGAMIEGYFPQPSTEEIQSGLAEFKKRHSFQS